MPKMALQPKGRRQNIVAPVVHTVIAGILMAGS
jgi:hypothetical protein